MAIRLNRFTGSAHIQVDYVRYRLASLLCTALIIVISLALSVLTGTTLEVIAALIALALFRLLTGGVHFGLDACVLITTACVYLAISVHYDHIWIVTAISMIIVLFSARKNTGMVIYGIIGLANFVICSDLIANCYLIQALSLIPSKRG